MRALDSKQKRSLPAVNALCAAGGADFPAILMCYRAPLSGEGDKTKEFQAKPTPAILAAINEVLCPGMRNSLPSRYNKTTPPGGSQ